MRVQAHEHGTKAICVSQEFDLLFSAGAFYPCEASSSDVIVWKLDGLQNRGMGPTSQMSSLKRKPLKGVIRYYLC